jgi:hypothetical protein
MEVANEPKIENSTSFQVLVYLHSSKPTNTQNLSLSYNARTSIDIISWPDSISIKILERPIEHYS